MLKKLQIQIERLGGWWCRVQHRSVRWPAHGEYECATCSRHYPVPWAEHKVFQPRIHAVSVDRAGVDTSYERRRSARADRTGPYGRLGLRPVGRTATSATRR
jgi:hypothetical protein